MTAPNNLSVAAASAADSVFTTLYSKFQRLVRMVAGKYCTIESLDDTEQTIWLAVLEALRSGRRPEAGHESGWIGTVARQTGMAERKKLNAQNATEISFSSTTSEGETCTDAMDRVAFQLDGYTDEGERLLSTPMSAAIEGLGKRAKQIFEMRFITGLSGEETAKMLGLSRGSVDVSISRSLKILRRDVKR